jgi:cyclopropane fatty-acyl-phospholipid synthase-like methyltransferase
MKKNEDAFGQAMYDYHRGRRVGSEIVERDDGFIEVTGGPATYFREYPDWAGFERRAIKHVAGRVLDVGCGAGRVALYLQERGWEVVGIDNSPLAIRTCRLRGLRDARTMSVTGVNSRLGPLDTIVMFGNNFGLVGDRKRAKWLLRRFHGMTSARGRILAQSTDPHQTKDPNHLQYHAQNRRRGRMPGQVRIRVRYRKLATPWWDLLLVSKEEMQELLRDTGWSIQKFVDSNGPSYVAVLRKDG